jgi:hypothetical protein
MEQERPHVGDIWGSVGYRDRWAVF